MNLNPSTLSSNLATLHNEGGFTTGFAKRIAEFLGYEVADFERMVRVDEDRIESLEKVENLFERMVGKFESFYAGYVRDRLCLIESLSRGDIHTVTTCNYPSEHYDFGFRDEVGKAVKRGAIFRYVFPDFTSHENLKKVVPDIGELLAQHGRYLEVLIQEGFDKSEIESSVQCRTTADPYLVSPFVSFVHLRRDFLGQRDVLVFGEAEFGNSRTIGESRYLYPMTRKSAQKIDIQLQMIFGESE